MEVNIEPQAGPSLQMEQGNTTPSFQAKDPAVSLGYSLPSSTFLSNYTSFFSRKMKRRTDVEELESAVKLFQGIQQDHNSSIKVSQNIGEVINRT
uniref:(California timema) hypothetical protein n=1 Tax=Timema californicum TaxID=61474 RepID=A0A7R9JL55_TIMCA|nr:unnamed protein product [Timema californicum]